MQSVMMFLRRLLKIRNVAPIAVILIAIVGSLDLDIFGSAIKSDQIIMALLGFLAIDALVERLELLTNLEKGVQTIQDNLNPQSLSEVFFTTRDVRRLEDIIHSSRSEICIYGVTLDTIVTLVPLLQKQLGDGQRIRILSPNPHSELMAIVAGYFASRPDVIAARLRGNLNILTYRLAQIQNGSLEVRTLDKILLTGFVISDAASSGGRMLIQNYVYNRVKQAPLFELSSEEDQRWFSVYVAQFEQAWADATEFDSSRIA